MHVFFSGFILSLFKVCYTAKILNLELSFETQSSKKNFSTIFQDIIVYMLKRKLAVFYRLFIFSPEELFTNAIHCVIQLKNVKCKTSPDNSKWVKKLIEAYSTHQTPSCILSLTLCSLRNSIFFTKNG